MIVVNEPPEIFRHQTDYETNKVTYSMNGTMRMVDRGMTLTASGIGSCKKEAKHHACLNFIQQIHPNVISSLFSLLSFLSLLSLLSIFFLLSLISSSNGQCKTWGEILDIYAPKLEEEFNRKTNPKHLKPNLNLLKNLKEMMEKYYPPPAPLSPTQTPSAQQSEVISLASSHAICLSSPMNGFLLIFSTPHINKHTHTHTHTHTFSL